MVHLFFDLVAYACAFLLGFYFKKKLLPREPCSLKWSMDYAYLVTATIGVIFGSILVGTLQLSMMTNHFSLGKSILGALAGGILAVEVFKSARKIRGSTGIYFVPSLAIGIFIGRWGCFFTGLSDYTYGIPTTLAWGYDFGDGLHRHPVQLYEGFTMLVFLISWVSGSKRYSFCLKNGFYIFVLVYGVQRFAWEFLKPYPVLWVGLNFFHFFCIGLIIYAITMMHKYEHTNTQAKTLSLL